MGVVDKDDKTVVILSLSMFSEVLKMGLGSFGQFEWYQRSNHRRSELWPCRTSKLVWKARVQHNGEYGKRIVRNFQKTKSSRFCVWNLNFFIENFHNYNVQNQNVHNYHVKKFIFDARGTKSRSLNSTIRSTKKVSFVYFMSISTIFGLTNRFSNLKTLLNDIALKLFGPFSSRFYHRI